MNPGIDITQLDPSIRVQDDLFRHVNGRWLRDAEIAPDRATAGSFVTLVDEAEATVRRIIQDCASGDITDDNGDAAKIGALFDSFMDEAHIESLGASPLASDLAVIDRLTSIDSLSDVVGSLESSGIQGLFGLYIAPDRGQPDRYIAHAYQSGLGLPDESYYRDPEWAETRTGYLRHLTTMLELIDTDDAPAAAERVLALETEIAAHHWDRVACRDAITTYNLMSTAELQALVPHFDLEAWMAASGVPAGALDPVVVAQPSYLQGLNELLTADRLASWRDWLRWQVGHAAAPYLSAAFVQENFAFYGRTLSGTDELRPRWKRAVGFVESALGEAVGRIYVRSEYPAVARQRMDALVANLIEAYRQSISDLEWMSQTTRERALDKLKAFTPKVGHPQKFKDYSSLQADPTDLVGNARRSLALETAREWAKIGAPINRDEWYMTPQTVNAYYNPTMNEIVFPAAILQPPFFHPDADDAVNYGAIGAVIGHEIGHGFDDQGSHYDGTGALNNWWTPDDRSAFEQRTAALIAQYDQLSPEGSDGHTVNGSLTIGENIGDLGGLAIAYRAFRLTEPDDQEIDGLTPDQRFFISWAQAWQAKVRPAETVRRLTTDPHSPPEFRCNQVVRNIDEFYQAFELTPTDTLWLAPEERVKVWSS